MSVAIVIGGGISGIASAVALGDAGYDVCVVESEEVLGGRIGSRRHGEVDIDLGGRNFGEESHALLGLLERFGVDTLMDYHYNSASVGTRHWFDMRSGGRPTEIAARWARNLRVAGPRQLWRVRQVSRGALGAVGGRMVGSPYWVDLAERTGDPTAAEYFGRNVTDAMFRPITLRMMASEPEEVFLGNLGPFLGGRPRGMKRIAGGMAVFLRAVADQLDVRYRTTAQEVLVERGRVVGVRLAGPDGRTTTEPADVVVLATPAPVAAGLVPALPALAAGLRRIAYRPVATVVAEYDDTAFPSDASGLFFPRDCVASHIARYDPHHRIRYSFAGVAGRAAMAGGSIEALLAEGEALFQRFGGRLGARRSHVGQIWTPGLCGHSRMHHRTLADLRAASSEVGGLVLAGDYLRGNLLDACAHAAQEAVAQLLAQRAAAA
ncbi:MAG: FAD-dependent oxidoreductase [Myxococcota bacterium]